MKMRLLKLLTLITILPFTSCNKTPSEKIKLSYGSLYDTGAIEIDYSTLLTKVNNEESFLLSLMPGEEKSITCLCYKEFNTIISNYVKDNERMIYKSNVYRIAEQDNNFGLKAPASQDPGFAIFKNGKLFKQYFYNSKKPAAFFKEKDELNKLLEETTTKPNLLYINDDQYKSHQDDESFVVSIVRKGCSDCNYILPNVLDPYFKNNEINKNLYLLDIEDLGHYKTSTEQEKATYQSYKDSIYLSNKHNSTYGYENGVVPTTFVFSHSRIIDGSVFFNDEVSKQDNKYIVSTSYYSSSRRNNLHYLDNVETPILEGLELNEDKVIEYEGNYYWKSSDSSKYHTPLLNAFLNQYLK